MNNVDFRAFWVKWKPQDKPTLFPEEKGRQLELSTTFLFMIVAYFKNHYTRAGKLFEMEGAYSEFGQSRYQYYFLITLPTILFTFYA